MKRIILSITLITSFSYSIDNLEEKIVDGISTGVTGVFSGAIKSINQDINRYNQEKKKKRERKEWEKERVKAKKDLFAQMNQDKNSSQKVDKKKNNMIVFE